MQIIYLDLSPTYIPFMVQCTKADGSKADPSADNLIIYEEGGADATFDSTTITGSPFDPAQINSKTGLWGKLVAKSAFTTGKFYIALWEMTIDSITTAYAERFFCCNAADFKATGFAVAGDSMKISVGTGTGQINLVSGAVPVSDKTGFSLGATYDRAKNALAYTEYTAAPSAAIIADSVWDEKYTDHVVAGSYSELIQDIDVEVDAIHSAVSNIAITGGSVNALATAFTLTTGGQTNTYAQTSARNGVYHVLTDTAGTLDAYYEFEIGAEGVPSQITIFGHLIGSNDSLNIQGYNWGTSQWVTVALWQGTVQTTDAQFQAPLFTSMVGTGANSGKVRIRLYNTGLSTATASIDQIYVSYSIVFKTVGYSNGAIWIDTVNGTAGTVAYTNGTADKPVNSITDALTLSIAIGVHKFNIANGSTITLPSNISNISFEGSAWTLNLNGKDISGCHFAAATVYGTATSASRKCCFHNCNFGNGSSNVSLPAHDAYHCNIATVGSYALTVEAGNTIWLNCCSATSGGNNPPRLIFADNADLCIKMYAGGIIFEQFDSTNKASFDCPVGQLILHTDCTGGLIRRAGLHRLIDNSGGLVTITDGYGMTISTDADGNVFTAASTDSTITPADVWSYTGGRAITDKTGFELTSAYDRAKDALKYTEYTAASTDSTITPADVWAYTGGRTITDKTGFALTSAYDRAKDALKYTEYTAAPTAVSIRQEMDSNSTMFDAIDSLLVTIAERTDRLPNTPADEATLTSISNKINGISNVVRMNVAMPKYMTIPAAGNNVIRVNIALKDSEGNMEDPDNNIVAINVTDSAGTSKNANLYQDYAVSNALSTIIGGTFNGFRQTARAGVGLYYFYYKCASTDTEGERAFTFGWHENSVALYEFFCTQVSMSVSDISVIASNVSTLLDRITESRGDKLDWLDATISSRLAETSYTAPPDVNAIADQVWNELYGGHMDAGSFGLFLYELTSRLTALRAAKLDSVLTSGAAVRSELAPELSQIMLIPTSAPVFDTSGLAEQSTLLSMQSVMATAGGEMKLTIEYDAIKTCAQSDTALSTDIWTPTIAARIDTAISSRMASDTYIAPDNAGISAVNLRLPAYPASVENVNTVGDLIIEAVENIDINVVAATGLATELTVNGILYQLSTGVAISEGSLHDALDSWQYPTSPPTPPIILLPENSLDCRVYLWIAGQSGITKPLTVTATAQIIDLPSIIGGRFFIGQTVAGTYDYGQGILFWDIVRGATVRISVPAYGVQRDVVLPDDSKLDLSV